MSWNKGVVRGCNLIWGLGFSSRLTGYQLGCFPCGCIIVVPVFLLAVGWWTLSAPKHHPQVLDTWTPLPTTCFLLSQQESISLTLHLLLKGSFDGSKSNHKQHCHRSNMTSSSSLIPPTVKKKGLDRAQILQGRNLRGLLKILPTVGSQAELP